MNKVSFFYLSPLPSFRNRELLKQFLEKLARKEGQSIRELKIIFCSDDYLLTMNQSYLKHDYFTDIITFQYNGAGQPLEGEIYISLDRVRDNAVELHEGFGQELHRVIFHGLLHLCGYNDKLKSDRQEMRRLEDRYLDLYFSTK